MGTPSGWGPVGMSADALDACLHRLTEAAGAHGAGVSMLRDKRHAEVAHATGPGTLLAQVGWENAVRHGAEYPTRGSATLTDGFHSTCTHAHVSCLAQYSTTTRNRPLSRDSSSPPGSTQFRCHACESVALSLSHSLTHDPHL